ncbi:PadR family transcriptional regulator [Nocardioides sp. HDW12B]|uniref:PadR family transcriptional regulator n=1 Tax=Nocardioides sp. HDW12B TaxID=2714939 RepID=UPI00140CFB4C|nr:PadR family transcriptional regulator [Nocardioides sp. HDW12B]QIK68034.1 PadR family transcriptional regulator [Nocardioides sp. HDW12B]
MASPPNSTSYALLGLLSVRSWSTYELAQQVHRSLRWFWPRTERRLYDEPKRLAAAGLVAVEERYAGRRRSRHYTITDEGREALSAWLGEPSAPRVTEFEAMVKVFFADAGDRDQLRRTLESIERESLERIAELRDLSGRPTNFPHRRHLHALCLPAMLGEVEATLLWSRWARERVEEWVSATDAGAWDPHAELARVAARATALLAGGDGVDVHPREPVAD